MAAPLARMVAKPWGYRRAGTLARRWAKALGATAPEWTRPPWIPWDGARAENPSPQRRRREAPDKSKAQAAGPSRVRVSEEQSASSLRPETRAPREMDRRERRTSQFSLPPAAGRAPVARTW